MKVFRLSGHDQYCVKDESYFLELTGGRAPWVQERNGKKSYFAICPCCGNPVHFINLIESKRSSKNLFPRADHFPHSVEGVAAYNKKKYERCPLASRNYLYSEKKNRRDENDPYNDYFINIVKNNLDRIKYILEKNLNVHISLDLIQKMLTNFLSCHNERIEALNKLNLPWLFLLSFSCPINKMMFKRNSIFVNKLRNKNIELVQSNSNDLFFFIKHKKNLSMSFVVSDYGYNADKDNEFIEICVHLGNLTQQPVFLCKFKVYIDTELSNLYLEYRNWNCNEKILELAKKLYHY